MGKGWFRNKIYYFQHQLAPGGKRWFGFATSHFAADMPAAKPCSEPGLAGVGSEFSEAARWEAGRHALIPVIFPDVGVVGWIKCY